MYSQYEVLSPPLLPSSPSSSCHTLLILQRKLVWHRTSQRFKIRVKLPFAICRISTINDILKMIEIIIVQANISFYCDDYPGACAKMLSKRDLTRKLGHYNEHRRC